MSPRDQPPEYSREDSLESIPSTKRRVQFGAIEMRVYNRILGDHPDVKVGPPIALGWEYNIIEPQPIDQYEEQRPKKKIFLRLNSITRKNLLKNEFDVPSEEIANAEKEIQIIKKQREKSSSQGDAGIKAQLAMETAKRKFFSGKRVLKALTLASGAFLAMPTFA